MSEKQGTSAGKHLHAGLPLATSDNGQSEERYVH